MTRWWVLEEYHGVDREEPANTGSEHEGWGELGTVVWESWMAWGPWAVGSGESQTLEVGWGGRDGR